MEILESTGKRMELCRTPLVTVPQSDVTISTRSLYVQPVKQLPWCVYPCIQLFCVGHFVQKDSVTDSMESFTKIKKKLFKSLSLNLMFCIVKVYQQIKQPWTILKCLTEYRKWQQNTLPNPIFQAMGMFQLYSGTKHASIWVWVRIKMR